MTNFNAVICRTNAGCVEVAIREHEAGQRVALIITGGLRALKDFAHGADDLIQGQRTDHPELAAFKNWDDAQAHAKSPEGEDLRPMVNLIDKYGTAAIYGVCHNSLDEKRRHEADIQVCTGHKSKGLEWDRVQVHGDFLPPKDKDGLPAPIPEDYLRLLYVVVTRARLVIDAQAIVWAF
jgi:superfamily I DNA/RNA helicase